MSYEDESARVQGLKNLSRKLGQPIITATQESRREDGPRKPRAGQRIVITNDAMQRLCGFTKDELRAMMRETTVESVGNKITKAKNAPWEVDAAGPLNRFLFTSDDFEFLD
jgi:hypothetical protein